MRANFSLTASKDTMSTQEFIDISERDKMMQEQHAAEHKQNACDAQSLEYSKMARSLLTLFCTSSYDCICATISKYLSGALRNRLCNDSHEAQISISILEIIFEAFGNIELAPVLEFFETDESSFEQLVGETLMAEHSKVVGLTTPVADCKSAGRITTHWNLGKLDQFLDNLTDLGLVLCLSANDNEAMIIDNNSTRENLR